jgi:hypothetical protein
MAKLSSTNRWRIVALCGVGLALGTWFAIEPRQTEHKPERELASNSTSAPSRPRSDGDRAPDRSAPDYRIAESGRLRIDAASLGENGVLALGLGLAPGAAGVEPLEARIASTDGRTFDTTAVRGDSADGDVRLEIDAAWLRPGSYMIQIKTAEKVAFPLRRYVLEVR